MWPRGFVYVVCNSFQARWSTWRVLWWNSPLADDVLAVITAREPSIWMLWRCRPKGPVSSRIAELTWLKRYGRWNYFSNASRPSSQQCLTTRNCARCVSGLISIYFHEVADQAVSTYLQGWLRPLRLYCVKHLERVLWQQWRKLSLLLLFATILSWPWMKQDSGLRNHNHPWCTHAYLIFCRSGCDVSKSCRTPKWISFKNWVNIMMQEKQQMMIIIINSLPRSYWGVQWAWHNCLTRTAVSLMQDVVSNVQVVSFVCVGLYMVRDSKLIFACRKHAGLWRLFWQTQGSTLEATGLRPLFCLPSICS